MFDVSLQAVHTKYINPCRYNIHKSKLYRCSTQASPPRCNRSMDDCIHCSFPVLQCSPPRSDVSELSELETKAAARIVELEGPGTSTDDWATPGETFGARFLLVVFVVCPLWSFSHSSKVPCSFLITFSFSNVFNGSTTFRGCRPVARNQVSSFALNFSWFAAKEHHWKCLLQNSAGDWSLLPVVVEDFLPLNFFQFKGCIADVLHLQASRWNKCDSRKPSESLQVKSGLIGYP